MRLAGIIICGGKSRRMGQPKAYLDFLGESLLARMVRLIGGETSHVIVCSACGQDLPEITGSIIRVDDQSEYGPIEGLFRGLALAREVECTRAFVAAVDLPLLRPALIGRMCSLMRGADDAVVACHQGYRQPLAALYRVSVIDEVAERIAGRQYALQGLLDRLRLREIGTEDYSDIDPEGRSFLNLNTPEDFRRVRQIAQAEPRPG